MNVAEYIAQFLVEKKVRHVFGYQGGAILKLLDEMIATGHIEYVQNFHEQASAFSADAYSRVTGNIGVAMATSGPGATNLVTGIANAFMDSIPTFFITGQDYAANITMNNQARQNGFQDLDIVSVVKPITKYAVLLQNPARVRYELEKAFWYATSGRPGSVLIDIPIDVQFKEIDDEKLEGFTPEPAEPARHADVSEIIALIKHAKRPVVLVGGGARISKAETAIKAFLEATHIPAVSTLNGLDLIENGYGFAGLHGNLFANMAVQNADVLLAFGVRFGQRQVGKKPEQYTRARVIHIDIDTHELQRIFPDEIGVHTDLKTFLTDMNAQLAHETLPTHDGWHETIRRWVGQYRGHAYLNKQGLEPVQAAETIFSFAEPNAIITNDVGQNQMWVAQAYRSQRGLKMLNSCGLGSMGYSLPAAIGAKVASPESQVIAFTGDGGLQMNVQELMLVGLRQLPIKCVVFNNNTLGMMREVQARYYNSHFYGSNLKDFACVDLEALAKSYRLGYRKAKTLAQVKDLKAAFADDRPYLIELVIAFDSQLSNRYDEAAFLEKELITHA